MDKIKLQKALEKVKRHVPDKLDINRVTFMVDEVSESVRKQVNHICNSRSTCMGCPFVDDDGYFVECKLMEDEEPH